MVKDWSGEPEAGSEGALSSSFLESEHELIGIKH